MAKFAGKFEISGVQVLWFLVACLLVIGCFETARAQDVDAAAPATAEAVLTGMANQAGVIFAGQVVGINRADENGYVDVMFQVAQAVKGCTVGSYTVREWVGLWTGQADRYHVGQSLLMLLTAKSVAGFSAPVNGMNGAIPLTANGFAPVVKDGVAPADTAANGDAANRVLADLRWIRAQAVRGVGTVAAAKTGPTAAAVSAGKAGWVPVTGTGFTPISDWVGPIAPMATAGSAADTTAAGQSTEPTLNTVLALLAGSN
jgi:hypothetical protein